MQKFQGQVVVQIVTLLNSTYSEPSVSKPSVLRLQVHVLRIAKIISQTNRDVFRITEGPNSKT